MSGAVNDSQHRATITAYVTPPAPDISVSFTLEDPSPATVAASLSAESATTDENGAATTVLTSSNTPDEGYAVTVTAKVTEGDGSDEQEVSVTLLVPDNEFYAPENP